MALIQKIDTFLFVTFTNAVVKVFKIVFIFSKKIYIFTKKI